MKKKKHKGINAFDLIAIGYFIIGCLLLYFNSPMSEQNIFLSGAGLQCLLFSPFFYIFDDER